MRTTWIAFALLVNTVAHAADVWSAAEANGVASQRAVKFADRYACGWLSHADPKTGLLPRRVDNPGELYWNSKDCAADNYPFLILTAYMTDNYYLKRAVQHIFEQEQRLTCRVDSLPDDFVFATHSFRPGEPNLDTLIFGAAEYCKDGLLPVTEWLGPSPWLDRMEQLLADIWKHARVDSPVGLLPSSNIEVNGDLLQALSRLYWLTGKDEYRDWAFRLADYYLLHAKISEGKSLRLVDHGCEVIGGLSEAYVIAAKTDPARRERYRPSCTPCRHRAEVRPQRRRMFWGDINPAAGTFDKSRLSDTWATSTMRT